MKLAHLRRHQLAWLGEAGWRRLQEQSWDDEARACLAHWAGARLPLVITRQSPEKDGDLESISLGLPAPGRWNRRRLMLRMKRSEVVCFDEFPHADKAARLLPLSLRSTWRALCAELEALDSRARVYGSYGWELMSGLDHVRKGSDIDLWLAVADAAHADAVAAGLQSFSEGLLRIDGELVFRDGSAVAWREWLLWRRGKAKSILVKSVEGSALVRSPAWQEAAQASEAA
ncbi:malonate decarboxylase holo-[acyl-carrier-protein] synthase [Burkholderiaceae bacterium UC74_6]